MVKDLFPPRREQLASYDFFDIASGTGYVSYDGVNARTSVGNEYKLIDSSLTAFGGTHGTDVADGFAATNLTVVNGNSGSSLDIDFNLSPFLLPRTIKGTGFLKITAVGDLASTTGGFVITAILIKESGGESALVTVVSETREIDESTTFVLPLVIPQTHFKKGDILRLTIQVTTSDNDQYGICHDPSNRANSVALTEVEPMLAGETRLILAIPYRVEL